MLWQWTPVDWAFSWLSCQFGVTLISVLVKTVLAEKYETWGSVGAKLMCTVQLSCISYSPAPERVRGARYTERMSITSCQTVHLTGRLWYKNELLDALGYDWNWYCIQPFSCTSCQYPLKIGDCMYFGGEVCLGWQRTRRQKCIQSKAVGNVSSFPSALDNASFPVWPEETGGWGSPQVISMRNPALSQLFPLPSFFYCLLSQPRMWIVRLSCIRAVFFRSDVQLPVYMVTYKWLWFSARESFFIFFTNCHHHSIAFKLQSWGTLADSAF